MMSRWRIVALGAVIIVIAACAYAFWQCPAALQAVFGPPAATDQVVVSGNIEAHERVSSFTQVHAPIIELPFDEGAVVQSGTVLARIDDRPYQQEVEIDRTDLQVATAQVTVNESNLIAAQNNVTSDQFDLSEKQRDCARAQELALKDAVSIQSRDLAQTAAQQSAAALARDQAMVKVAQANIDLAQRNVDANSAKLKLDEITLAYAVLRAPFTGAISVREAELGQLAGPGVAIFTPDDLDHIWVRAYVNEPDIGKIRLGEAVDVTTDTYPVKIYLGHISFISPQAEFTPKTVETHAERVTLVYRIRIDIDNPTHELLPGMPADATIPLLAPGK